MSRWEAAVTAAAFVALTVAGYVIASMLLGWCR